MLLLCKPCVQGHAALLSLPGFDPLKHAGFDVMHMTAGIVNDTVVGLLMKRRIKDWVREFESTHNGNRFRSGDIFAASAADRAAIEEALQHVVAATDSRIAGSRVLRLLHSSKKNKSHTMSLMASDYGEYGCAMVSRSTLTVISRTASQ
jgi:hypothetical protein